MIIIIIDGVCRTELFFFPESVGLLSSTSPGAMFFELELNGRETLGGIVERDTCCSQANLNLVQCIPHETFLQRKSARGGDRGLDAQRCPSSSV